MHMLMKVTLEFKVDIFSNSLCLRAEYEYSCSSLRMDFYFNLSFLFLSLVHTQRPKFNKSHVLINEQMSKESIFTGLGFYTYTQVLAWTHFILVHTDLY